MVLSASPSQGVWGAKRSTLNPRRQLGEGRTQGFAACLPHPNSSLQRCLVALAIPLCHWRQCRGRRRKTRHGSKSSALAGPQHPAWVSFLLPAPPGNKPCPELVHVGAAATQEGTVWTASQIHSTGNQPSSFVTHSRADTMGIQGNFMFAYERTLDVSWGEDL